MKINVSMNTLFVMSAYDIETLKKVMKYRPEALRLYKGDGDKREVVCVFDVCRTESMSDSGFCFATDNMIGEKVAMIHKDLPSYVNTEDKAREFVRECLGMAIVYGNQIEAQIAEALESIDSDIRTMNAAITIDAGPATAVTE